MEFQRAWNANIGSNKEYTLACLVAMQGLSKPNATIREKSQWDEDILNGVIRSYQSGATPSFYNDSAYYSHLVALGVEPVDAETYCFGGCSELQIAGKSNTGSIDAGINLIEVLNKAVLQIQEPLSMNEIVQKVKKTIKNEIKVITKEVNINSLKRGKTNPQMVRSLLSDGCVEQGLDFNEGGAPYNFSTINVVGLANAVDSPYTIDELVFQQKRYNLEEIVSMLRQNKLDESFVNQTKKLIYFGNDNARCDKYAKVLFNSVVKELKRHQLKRGNGVFLPACIIFDSVAIIGSKTGCSLDGRMAGEQIADSGGAMTGKDKTSPTALLNSISTINPSQALGTWVVNLTFSNRIFASENGRQCFKSLILGYFD